MFDVDFNNHPATCEQSIELKNGADDVLKQILCNSYNKNNSIMVEQITSHYLKIDFIDNSLQDQGHFFVGFAASEENVSFSLRCPYQRETICLQCENMVVIPHGDMVLHDDENTSEGALANITCDDGYDSDKPTIECLNNGKWENATCHPKDCGNVSAISNGKYELKDEANTTFGAMATVTCVKGYESDTNIITCLDNGQWSDSTCTAKDCGNVSALSNGIYVLDDEGNTTFGAVAIVICDKGYESDSNIIMCLDVGQWSNSSCTVNDCGNISTILHGKIVLKDKANTTFGAMATVICDKGYESVRNNITCLDNGQWSSALCSAKDCGSVSAISNGKYVLENEDNTTFGAMATVICDEGYESDSNAITCLENGQWSRALCSAKDCGIVPTISNGRYTLEDEGVTTFGAMATVICDEGYESDSNAITCLENGQWSSVICTVKDCGIVPTISNGRYILEDEGVTTFGAMATVTCDEGYDPDNNTITCLGNGQWSSTLCTIKDCGNVHQIGFGTVTLSSSVTTFGAVATVACETGYTASLSTVECLSTGKWEAATCNIIDCGSLYQIDNGTVSLSSISSTVTTYGTVATVTCDAGFNASQLAIQCLSTGKWQVATCNKKDCGEPVIQYGSATLKEVSISTFGSAAEIKCQEGYQPKKTTIKCEETGLWESSACEYISDKGNGSTIAIAIIVSALLIVSIVIVGLVYKKRQNRGNMFIDGQNTNNIRNDRVYFKPTDALEDEERHYTNLSFKNKTENPYDESLVKDEGVIDMKSFQNTVIPLKDLDINFCVTDEVEEQRQDANISNDVWKDGDPKEDEKVQEPCETTEVNKDDPNGEVKNLESSDKTSKEENDVKGDMSKGANESSEISEHKQEEQNQESKNETCSLNRKIDLGDDVKGDLSKGANESSEISVKKQEEHEQKQDEQNQESKNETCSLDRKSDLGDDDDGEEYCPTSDEGEIDDP
ncbi:sushi, von Willebrand factor type A, EGF and pentraxin domain-containing protein 1-like isoform X2 [Ruditapes philippinarum]|nr:sushi, von Willebrand factor type A, EGF and pentraxin domain-containing protein 1-like isoform X2 [Ruditapes philippinarum]